MVLAMVFPDASAAVIWKIFNPRCKIMPSTNQLLVPVAMPLPPRSFDQVTCVTALLSDTSPAILIAPVAVEKVGAAVGEVILRLGGVSSGGKYVIARVWLLVFPLASTAVNVRIFSPTSSAMPETIHEITP